MSKRSEKAKHDILTLLYTAPTWLECGLIKTNESYEFRHGSHCATGF